MECIDWCGTIQGRSDFPSERIACATAATNALEHAADLAEVRQILGHANIATTRMYDQRDSRPEQRPVFKVRY
ncbi:MAG: hypothetical protein OJF47_002227 [Nitrospira sp.]|jgi:integrase|nr:MAG: hypothetical protein OJF47_002227 [Nitrospira sp.]